MDKKFGLVKLHHLFVALYGACALALPVDSWAQTAGAAFLTIPSSPRSYSLGQSNLAAEGAQAIGVNPANLNLTPQRYEVFTSYSNVIGGEQYTHVAGAFMLPHPYQYLDALGLAVTSLNISNIQGADTSGNLTGSSFGAGNLAVSLAAAGQIMPDLRWGATLKTLNSSIAGYNSGTTMAADLGARYDFTEFSKPMSVAASVTNMGPGIKFMSQTDALPTSIDIGWAGHFGSLMTVFDVNRLVSQQVTQFGLGAEYAVGPVAFRIGYRDQNSGTKNLAAQDQHGFDALLVNGLVFGVGINMGLVALDYGVGQEAADFAISQHVALTVHWGGAAVAPEKVREQPHKISGAKTLEEHFARATELMKSGQYDDAGAELEQTVTLLSERDPRYIRYYELMGRLEWDQNHLAEAQEFYVRAIRFNQTVGANGAATADAYAGLAFCLEKEDDIGYAVKFFTKALELKPDPDVRRLVEDEIKKLAAQTTPHP